MTHQIRQAIAKSGFIPPRAVATASTPRHAEIVEQQRLAAVFNPEQRSGCRSCGRWVGPRGGFRELDGWRLCQQCDDEFVQPEGRAEMYAWRFLLDDDQITDDEAVDLRIQFGSPWRHACLDARADEPGQDKRFAHVPKDTIRAAKALLRAQRDLAGLSVNELGVGCGWCGCSLSFGGWFRSRLTIGQAGTNWPVCSNCHPHYLSAGQPMTATEGHQYVLGAALGLMRAGRPAAAPVGSIDFQLRPFCAISPTGSTPGSEQPWAYASEVLPAIRLAIGSEFPHRIELTAAERSEIAQRRAMKEANDAIEAARAARRISVLG